mmetsp:Transcript_18229/g.58113  ORF Transcript_18229/g.58113 Transcript_18229/m.58113 type:complete len:224 (+) Transcript_18229:711-1382(+)
MCAVTEKLNVGVHDRTKKDKLCSHEMVGRHSRFEVIEELVSLVMGRGELANFWHTSCAFIRNVADPKTLVRDMMCLLWRQCRHRPCSSMPPQHRFPKCSIPSGSNFCLDSLRDGHEPILLLVELELAERTCNGCLNRRKSKRRPIHCGIFGLMKQTKDERPNTTDESGNWHCIRRKTTHCHHQRHDRGCHLENGFCVLCAVCVMIGQLCSFESRNCSCICFPG